MEFSIREKIEGAKQFLREVKTELKKVTWPTKKDALSGTVVVLVAVFIVAFFLGIVDWGLSDLVKRVIESGHRLMGRNPFLYRTEKTTPACRNALRRAGTGLSVRLHV